MRLELVLEGLQGQETIIVNDNESEGAWVLDEFPDDFEFFEIYHPNGDGEEEQFEICAWDTPVPPGSTLMFTYGKMMWNVIKITVL